MRTIAVMPVKSLDAAKRRLAPRLGAGSRHLLAQAMFSDVLSVLRRVRTLDAIAVVTDDHEIEALLRGERVTVLEDDRRDGQSAAALVGIRHAQAEGYRRVLLVPGDTPLVDAAEVDDLLETARAERLDVAIVPDRHREGTNALVICPPDRFEPSFGPGSLERHLEAARAAELSHRVEEVGSLLHDVDTAEDLAALGEELERRRGVAPRTRGALRQLQRLRARPAEPPAAADTAADDAPAGASEAARSAVWRPTREAPAAEQRPAWT